ncbi:MAG TPA: hypothetical protein VMD58_07080 [Acidobacteriaceae bacterium]|nr:hypothetical protein [Acidobacteriaceae bacterium]
MHLLGRVIESRRADTFPNLRWQTDAAPFLRCGRLLWCVIGLVLIAGRTPVLAAGGNETSKAPLPVETIVQQLVLHNQQRAEEIGTYVSTRHYHIEYRGFPHGADADLVVDTTCNGPFRQKFQIVSESGSHLLVNHVLIKLLKTEVKAAADHASHDLTPANYNFKLIRSEVKDGRRMYVLQVEPKVRGPLLYRGTIWVDARDYAVAKIEAQPAKSPSFWIRDTTIHHVYEKTGEFWLPELDRSESRIRLGGKAILTIDYTRYRFVRANVGPSDPSTTERTSEVALSAVQ